MDETRRQLSTLGTRAVPLVKAPSLLCHPVGSVRPPPAAMSGVPKNTAEDLSPGLGCGWHQERGGAGGDCYEVLGMRRKGTPVLAVRAVLAWPAPIIRGRQAGGYVVHS